MTQWLVVPNPRNNIEIKVIYVSTVNESLVPISRLLGGGMRSEWAHKDVEVGVIFELRLSIWDK